MSAIPARTGITNTPSPSNATAEATLAALYDFVAQRMAAGTAGAGAATAAELEAARTSLGVPPRATRVDVASVAGVVNLTTAAPYTDDVQLTGSLAITGFTVGVGRVVRVTVGVGAAPSLVASASIDTKNGADLALQEGDTFSLRATAANVVEVLNLVRGPKGANAARAAIMQLPPVRQTVLNGPVDANGAASFGGAVGSGTVTAAGTLVLTSANGMSGDRIGSVTNPQWTGLTTNGSMYLYLDIAADGSCTTGSTTLAPNYQPGGAYSTVAGQFTFNTQEMVGKVGNGATAEQTHRVFVGEVTVAGGVVTAIVWYALLGRYVSAFTNTLPGVNTSVSFNHKLGNTIVLRPLLALRCITADNGYAPNDLITDTGTTAGTQGVNTLSWTRNTCQFAISSSSPFYVVPKAGGAFAALTAANWAYSMAISRGW